MTNEVKSAFGVDEPELTIEYERSCSMVVSIPDIVTEEEALGDIHNAIAKMVDVGPDNVELSLNMETDEVLYSVTTELFKDSERIRDTLNADDAIEKLNERTALIEVSSIPLHDDIRANIRVNIDADKTSVSANTGGNLLKETFGDQYEIVAGGKNQKKFSYC